MAYILIAIGLALFACLIYLENHTFEITPYIIQTHNKGLHGLRIVQVSDVHNAVFGKENQDLVDVITEMTPDVILITGDLFDTYKTKEEIGLHLAKQLVTIAPTYYITGNHEARIEHVETLIKTLQSQGVVVLRNNMATFEYQGQIVEVVGMEDGSFYTDIRNSETIKPLIQPHFDRLLDKTSNYRILLSHRPEFIPFYAGYPFDLGFGGHAHGGQWRIPFIGAVFAPEQGMFPKYTQGVHDSGQGQFIVSRGLGYSKLRFRLGNRPELVMVTLQYE